MDNTAQLFTHFVFCTAEKEEEVCKLINKTFGCNVLKVENYQNGKMVFFKAYTVHNFFSVSFQLGKLLGPSLPA